MKDTHTDSRACLSIWADLDRTEQILKKEKMAEQGQPDPVQGWSFILLRTTQENQGTVLKRN